MLNERNSIRGTRLKQPGRPVKENEMLPTMVGNAGPGLNRKTALIVEGGAVRGFDYVAGCPYADGGVAGPIPLQRAIQEGATDISSPASANKKQRIMMA
jgi:predicted acylesterase/phospholipase RssA